MNPVHAVGRRGLGRRHALPERVLSPTLLDLDPMVRAQVTPPFIPKPVLLFGSLLVATPVTGAALVGVTVRDDMAPVMLAAWLVGLLLLRLGAHPVRIQMRIHRELHGGDPDMDRIGALAGKLGKFGVLAAAVQVATLVVMALLRSN